MTGGKTWGDDVEQELEADEVARAGKVPKGWSTDVDPATGTKTVVEYRENEDGAIVKVTKRVKVVRTKETFNKAVRARQGWAKFGLGLNTDNDVVTTIGDPVYLEKIEHESGEAARQAKAKEDALNTIVSGGATVSCRHCGGAHWTRKCPFQDIQNADGTSPANADGDGDGDKQAGGALGSGTGKYVPPSLRHGANAQGESMRRDDNCTVRVTNLSDSTTEEDLHDLFSPFGPVARVFLSKDRYTNESRGFAFIKYYHRMDAERAIATMHGKGFDHSILCCDWARPPAEK